MRKILFSLMNCVLLLVLQPGVESAAGQALPRGTKGGFIKASDGVKIHYLEAGQTIRVSTKTGTLPAHEGDMGGPILFVPGWSMPADIWEHQINHFAKSRRVVAMDPRGQGKSDKPNDGYHPAQRARDIKAVIEQLKLAPVVVVGWSMGVTELAAYVHQFGTEGIAAIVLVDGIAGSDFDPQRSPALFRFAASFLTDRAKTVDSFVRSMYRKPQSEEYIERIKRASQEMPLDSSIAVFVGTFAADFRPALTKINVPAMVVAAGDDKTNPWMARYHQMAESIPGGRFEMMPGCGHALFVDDPAKFNALLDDFLAKRPKS